jgi:hypothetical protein
MQQYLRYPNADCTGSPASAFNLNSNSISCTGSGSLYSKYSCGAAPIAYAGLMKYYTDSACSTFMTTAGSVYFGVNQKADTCVAYGSTSAQISCSASAVTRNWYSSTTTCSGSASSTTAMNTACVRRRIRVIMRCVLAWVSHALILV